MVAVKATLTTERGRWDCGVSSRVIGLGLSDVIASGESPAEAISALTTQLEALLGHDVLLILERT